MNQKIPARLFLLGLTAIAATIFTGCDKKNSGTVATGEKFTVVDTRTDNFDYARAKANAQDAMASVPDLACMVGLFAYNAPQCMEAAKEAGKIGSIKIVSFDEADAVLQGIADGTVVGTISQQPYYYGYESVRILSGLASGSGKKKLAYVTNGVDPFWNTAVAGVRAAEKEFGVECEVLMPPKGAVDQKRMIEGIIARGVDGMAISPVDAKNQVDLINEAAARFPVITHDSDAPDSKRLCFVGMDNYKAGRAAGKLVKSALPQGGKVMIFVGRLEQLNAQQRRQGVVDELLDRPSPTTSAPTKVDAPSVASGDKSALPPNGYLEIPIVEVTKANVEKFRVDLKKMQEAGK